MTFVFWRESMGASLLRTSILKDLVSKSVLYPIKFTILFKGLNVWTYIFYLFFIEDNHLKRLH